MGTLARRRLVSVLPTLLITTVVVFALQQIIPGGPAEAIAGGNADARAIAALRAQLGLDRPLPLQYLSWLEGVLHGDLGSSYYTHEPVAKILLERAVPTLELVGGAVVVGTVLGCLSGFLATVRSRRPDGRLVFADHGAYDGVIQAMSGVPSVSGSGGEPALAGVFVADHLAAWQACAALLLALERRGRTGAGEVVDLSMLDGYFATVAHWVGEVLDMGMEPVSHGNRVRTAFANTFRAADGWVYLAPLGPAWTGLCEALERPDWLELGGPVAIGERRRELEAEIERWTSRRPRDEIVRELRSRGVPCGPVSSMSEAVGAPPLRERGMVAEVELQGQRLHVPGPPVRVGPTMDRSHPHVPDLGEDTEAVLRELGHDPCQISAWAESGLIRTGGRGDG